MGVTVSRHLLGLFLLFAALAPAARAAAPATPAAPIVITFAEQAARLVRTTHLYRAGRGVVLRENDMLESGSGAIQLDAGGATIGIDRHSDTAGPAREPSRMLIDLFVDDISAEQTRLEANGVKFIRDKGKEYWGGVISTFQDPDGNYVQLIEYKQEAAQASA